MFDSLPLPPHPYTNRHRHSQGPIPLLPLPQVTVIAKDEQIKLLVQQKKELERKYGINIADRQSGVWGRLARGCRIREGGGGRMRTWRLDV